jgi:type VI secretion system protein ImpG
MEPTLRDYYEQELRFLRHMASEFADKYPKLASRLVLREEDNPDPHVERLLEGVAFLAARVHLKIDDDFHEITDALLNLVYPHYIRPIPSMTVVEFQLDPQQGKLSSGLRIPRASMLYSRPVNGSPCKFTTTQEVTLWPVEVAAAEWRAAEKIDPPVRGSGAMAVIRLELRCSAELTFDKLALGSLRFYLSGDGVVHSLYELLLNNCTRILVRDPNDRKRAPVLLPPTSLRAAGFEEEEALLPYPRRSFDGYRLLQEYFAFPRKFHFLDLTGLDLVTANGFRESVEVLFLLSPFERQERWEMLELGTAPTVFRLGCAPAVNLFPQTSEPILLKHTDYEYLIVPDARRHRSMEIFSVDEVVSTTAGSSTVTRYEPFFSFRHNDTRGSKQALWHATRRDAPWRKEGGTDVFLSLLDLSGKPTIPDVEALTLRLTCSNRDLPSYLPFGSGETGEDKRGDFELEGGGPIRRIIAREKPTPSLPAPARRAAFWRLISHLSLNHLSLVAEGRDALREILQLYNFTDSTFVNRQIQGIRTVSSRPHFAPLMSQQGISFARGTRVAVELDEEEFAGSGVFVFASVLERFLGMYASLNSFSQLTVRTSQRKEVLRQWPPRAGRKILM